MGKQETKAAPAKAFADMSPEEQAAYVKNLEAKNAAAESEKKSLKAKLKEAKVDDVDTSFEVVEDGKKVKYDFVGKRIHIFGETVDVRQLIEDNTEESNEKFDAICAELVKIKSGLIKPI